MKKLGTVLLLLLFCISTVIFAAESKTEKGVITDVSGKVVVLRGGDEIAVKAGDKLFQKDVIKTMKKASATIEFKNGRVVSLNQNRTAKVKDLVRPKINKKWLKKLKFKKMISGNDEKELKSHSAVVGVRGDEKAHKNKLSQEYIWIDNGLPEETEKQKNIKNEEQKKEENEDQDKE